MATEAGTRQYFKRLQHKGIPAHAVRTLGKTGFRVGSIGFGGYRVHHDSAQHAKALRYALLNGVNLIDTSSNYTDGGSEMLVGNLLAEMFEREELERDEIVVVSKVGYVQGQNLQLARQSEADGTPFPEMVKYVDDCWHCIHPDYLEDQLSRSLERLHLSHLDVYLLHNPEYYLSDRKKHNGADRTSVEAEYYRRIKAAFEWMEEKVAEGRIKAYGVSSNTFVNPTTDFEFSSLEKMIAVANSVRAENFFQVVQFPFNLMETGAYLEKNQAEGTKTLLELARDCGFGTMANRPLNCVFGERMIRMANFATADPKELIDTFHTKLTSVQRLEKQFRDRFLDHVPEKISKENVAKVFSLARQLDNGLSAFTDLEHWDHIKQSYLLPQLFSYLNYLQQEMQSIPNWQEWGEKYATTALEFVEAISQKYQNQAEERSAKLSGKLKSLEPELAMSETLSQQALRVLTAVSGIDSVLLGMRRTAYVEDATSAMKADLVVSADNLLGKFSA